MSIVYSKVLKISSEFMCGQDIKKRYNYTFYIAQNKSFAKNEYRFFEEMPHIILSSI